MKIRVDSNRLAKACTLAYKNIPSKTTLPIIKNIHIKTEPGMLHISTTDMETWVVYDVPAEVEYDETPSSFCMDASNVTSLLHAIPSQPITITLLEREHTNPKCYYAMIAHSSGTSELPVELSDDFPVLRPIEGEGVCVDASSLKNSIQTCRFALFADAELKPSLAALCLDFKAQSLVAVGASENQMARLEHPGVESNPCQVLVSRKPLTLLLPALDEVLKDREAIDTVVIRRDEYNVCIQTETASIYFRQIEQKYPNYDAVIPKPDAFKYQAVMNRSDLMAAISRAALFTNADSMKLVFKFDAQGFVWVRGECVDFATSSDEKVQCSFDGGADFSIALKATILQDILSHLSSEEICFSMIDQTRQVVVKEVNGDENVLMLLMPMLIDF